MNLKPLSSTVPLLKLCLYLLPAVLILTGCAASPGPSTRPPLPVSLAQPCPPVKPFDSADWDELAEAFISLVYQYNKCAVKHDSTVELWDSHTKGKP